ncbi:MAG TPA: bifunctional adenosylcobinamide kinase/adenosylcobinamide-phosphate guanylyltransferase [Candidatus Limnocylindrales bacterium]|nr:bifunctional adenosylcobinamide kinase/adenosylcobinamide-phosphate guanylyltransferase [Candidatus Limnocylindrales bacterium]
MSRPLVVVLGGTRSGKSRFGRDRAAALAGDGRVTYIATALPGDPELDDRIARHRRDRPGHWTTVEPGAELPDAVRSCPPGTTILIDGLTLWLSLLVTAPDADVDAVLDGPIAELVEAIGAHDGPVIVVSDEIGLGLVPSDPLSRRFRDALGFTHQRLVEASDEAWFLVAGRPIRLAEIDAANP